ncbi:helix-turn-helix domain-containing protein [Cohnella zeiphila]|uniref:AraC family transcriptional regulator n=1 Tax=Cohnella zeiphila TaxID=2761120 RepID=A0A7X0ST96_9BACL|nr:helix-turn-helix domain-containing protein [Cohnella zeiphila]MBB6735706.1 AraC family transcriptional regulator [Cohnella zeiphila]
MRGTKGTVESRRGRGRKQSVFLKYAVSYLVILFIPIIIGSNQYYKTERVLVDDAAELNLQILRMSQETVDRLFLEVSDVVSAISVDNDVLGQLQNTNSPPTPNQIYSYSLLRNSLNRYIFTNKYFFDIFLTFGNSGTVVTSKTTFDLSDDTIRIDGRPFGEWVDDVSQRSNQKQYYNVNEATIGSQTYKLIAYVSPLPNGFQGKVQGSIVVFIDQRDITGLFERLVVKNGGFAYIRDPHDRIIAATSPEEAQIRLPRTDELSGTFFQTVDGRSMLVSYSRSDQNGWTYIAALPSNEVLAKAEYMRRAIIVIALVTLVLGGIAALLFAYRNSKPISELMESVADFAKGERENGKRVNVYRILQNAVTDIIDHNRMLNRRMEQQLPMLQLSVLEKMLQGSYRTEEQIRAAMSQARIELRGDRCFAIAMAAYKEGIPYGDYSADPAVQEFVLRQIRARMEGADYVVCMNGSRADVIVTLGGDGADAERQREELRRRWEEQPDDAGTEADGMRLAVGVGRLEERLTGLHRSRDEARQALDYYVPGDPRRAIWYEDLPQDSGYYYYPLELELKLMNTVKSGDPDSLDSLLRLIQEENWNRRQLGAATKKQLLTEVHGTLRKLLEQVEFAKGNGELSDRLSGLDPAESEPGWEALEEALRAVCGQMDQGKKQKSNKKTAQAVLERVHARFADPNLSLASLAAEFKLSESFLSMLFKEHAGDNFSDYVEKLRMDQACVLLKETGKNVNDIALEVGYNSDKTFRRAFKRVMGVQPTSYRDSLKA